MRAGTIVGGKFELLKVAGTGGMGEVYRAKDLETGQPVAVKVMPGRSGDDAARFAREARVLSELAHPYIVRYVTHGVTPAGDSWLAMEWLEGEDLSARLSRGPLGLSDSVKLAIAAAEALGFAHARGVIHRDLKPSNIFLVDGKLDQLKLLDFGIAQVGGATRMTRTGMLLGTPGYMAPEQVHGGGPIDARADVFSLGCVLFEALTGEPLFAGENVLAILAKIVLEQAPSAKERRPDVPDALDALLSQMLAKEPAGRPEHGHAVALSLRALGEIPAPARADEQPPPARSRARRALTGSEQRAVALILVGAGALAKVGALAPTIPGNREATLTNPRVADATIDLASEAGIRATAALHEGHCEHLLDGSMVVVLTGTTLATDLAAQAARCALALRAHASGRPIALAMGRGEVAGSVPMGRAIDRAARLLSGHLVAPDDERGAPVMLDDTGAGLLDARFDAQEADGGFVLLGERVLGEGTRTLLGKATPCVGRERELRILEQLFDACVDEGAAQAVLVTAQAGVGKSRLAQELLRHVRDRREPLAVWIGRGDSQRAGSAFGLLGQALRGACGVRDGEPLEVRRQKVGARVAERVAEGERRRVTEFLGELLGAPFPDEDSPPLWAARRDAQLMNDQMRAAFLSFLAAECAAGPVLILLEDLHWGDRPTVDFLDKALSNLREMPIFVLALARPEVHEVFPRLWGERGSHDIRLKELGRKPIERLVRHVLGDTVSAEVVDRLARLSDGNAFYLEELIRWAAEGRGGELPESVVAMVRSRLGALDDSSRRVLRAASVFGEVFWSGAVASLLGGQERATSLRDRLRQLLDMELLMKRGESRFPGEDEYAFRHALLREGALAMLTEEDRRLGHRLAGEWLLARGEQDALALAEHFEQGGDGARAGFHYLRAAQRATSGSDTTRAIACIERGLALPVPDELRLRLLGLLCEAHMYRMELSSAALPRAQELLRKAERGSVPWAQALLISLIGAAQTGASLEFAEALDAAMVAEFQLEALELASLILCMGGYLKRCAGAVREGEAPVKRAEALVRPMADKAPSAAVYCDINAASINAFADEDPWSGLAYARSALARALSIDHGRYVLGARMLILMNLWFLGAYAEAEREASAHDLPDHEFGLGSSFRPFAISWLLADMGSLGEARVWGERLVASGEERKLPHNEARGRWVLAEVLRRAGEFEAAEAPIKAALAMLGVVCPLDTPGALATLAALRLAQGRPAEALAAADEGLAEYESMGGCGMFRGAFLRLVHAECLEAAGRREDARAAIDKARQCLLVNADKIADPTYREGFLRNVPENRRTLDLAQAWLGGAGPAIERRP